MLWPKVTTTHHLTLGKKYPFHFFSNIGNSYKKVATWFLSPTLEWTLVTCVEQLVKHGGSWSLGYSFCGKQFKAIFFVRMKGDSFRRGNIKKHMCFRWCFNSHKRNDGNKQVTKNVVAKKEKILSKLLCKRSFLELWQLILSFAWQVDKFRKEEVNKIVVFVKVVEYPSM